MNDLTTRLAVLADDMAATDFVELRGRVDVTSRRLGRRQAAVTSVAAFALVGILLAGGAAFLGRGDQRTGPTGGVSTAPASPTATPATTPVNAPRSVGVARALPGTLSYLSVRAGRPAAAITVSNGTGEIGAGGRTTTVFGSVTSTEPFVGALSPDRSKLAVIESIAGSQEGELVVMEPGGARRALAHNVFWGGGVWPGWTPDSTAVIARIGGAWKKVDVADGTVTAVAGLGAGSQYITWSANATWWAYSNGSNKVTVSRPDGSGKRQASLAGLPQCAQEAACPFAVQAVSDDGRYVALGHGNTDPQHVDQAELVFDLQTKKLVNLPRVSGELSNVYFRSDGGLVLRSLGGNGAATLYLLDADRAVTGSLPDPVLGITAKLVAYRQ